MDKREISLLTLEELDDYSKRKIIDKECEVTDFAILLGEEQYSFEFKTFKHKNGEYYTSTRYQGIDPNIIAINTEGEAVSRAADNLKVGIRPVIKNIDTKDVNLFPVSNSNTRFVEVEYGEYPQYVVSDELANELDYEFARGSLNKTGKVYENNPANLSRRGQFILDEYEYRGKKYVRVRCDNSYKLTNGKRCVPGEHVWVEVSPIKWQLASAQGILVSSKILAAGVAFNYGFSYDNNFETTEMYRFLNKDFKKSIVPSEIRELTEAEKEAIADMKKRLKELEKRINPYGLDFDAVSEEDIIRGAIESNVPVFLHGPSSEGKSARVKQIDPDCEIIYLRNATPEGLNGKSVYNDKTGEMIDIKPSWLVKLEGKCAKEPDKIHVLFFDEISNALPSIQGIAFNVVLDREVNGKWKLPENARIVAAGNEMKDSLSANPIAEPLFNRFAHVYIETTKEKWLEWASKNNIHPAIFSYIAYTNGETLRTEYNGETPNADPRKWEMASKMLYKTNNPEMIRALVGEDITREFVKFCRQAAISLKDVTNDNYTEEDINNLNTAESYATTMVLAQVDEANLEKVRNFVRKLGAEFLALFDAIWTHGDEKRLELLAEIKLTEKGGNQR